MNGIIVERSPLLLAEDTLAVVEKRLGVEGIERSIRRAAGYPIDAAED